MEYILTHDVPLLEKIKLGFLWCSALVGYGLVKGGALLLGLLLWYAVFKLLLLLLGFVL